MLWPSPGKQRVCYRTGCAAELRAVCPCTALLPAGAVCPDKEDVGWLSPGLPSPAGSTASPAPGSADVAQGCRQGQGSTELPRTPG